MATAPQRVNLKPENVDDDLGRDESDIDAGLDDRLSAEEEAQIAAMQRGERDADGAAEPDAGGDDGGSDDGADGADGVDDGGEAAAAGERDADAGDGGGKQADKSQQRPPKTINYGRHQRELAKRDQRLTEIETALKTEREERQRERERATRLDERTKLLMEAINAPKQPPKQEEVDQDPEPSKDEDPIGWNEWKIRRLERMVSDLETGVSRDREQRETQTSEQREFNDYMSEVQAAGSSDPTFADAFAHLRESRYTELGYLYAGIDINDPEQCATLTPQEQSRLSQAIQQSFGQEQMLAYREARRAQRPVSKTIISLARARGFDPAKKAAAAAQEQQEDRGGQQQERRAAVPAKRPAQNGNGGRQPTVGEQVDAVREALASGKSLSDGGGSQGEQLDLTRLADMTDEEFEEVYSKIPKGKFDRMMGKQPN